MSVPVTGLPLTGLTVVALEQAVAAPFATRQLADLGARVVKVERPGDGDFARGYDQTVHGQSSYFVWLNRGKQSLTLDLKDPADHALLLRLLDGADVFVSNLAPGAVERAGLGDAALRARNPRLVTCTVSGYGEGGPYADRKAYDLLVQCEAGLVGLTGSPDEPAKVGISVADIAAGMYAFTGVLTALYERERTGAGSCVQVSMLEALAEWVAQPLLYAEGSGAPPPRSGARHASIAPYGPYRVAGGEQVFLGIQNDREWRRFCAQVLSRPELADDPRFATNPLRVAHDSELTAVVEQVLGGLEADDVLARLEAAGIANARLRTMAGLGEHPQLAARDRWRTVDSPGGAFRALLPPVTVPGREPLMGPVPAVGEQDAGLRAEFAAPSSSAPPYVPVVSPAEACTWMFVPGDRPDRFAKAVASGADCVVLDLEDAVAPDRKDAARGAVGGFLGGDGAAWVRVNAVGASPHLPDLQALAGLPGLRGVLLPKAERAADVTAVATALGVGVVPLVESAVGLLAALELARADGTVRLAFGSVDYAGDLGAEHVAEALLHARSVLVLVSRAAGLPGPVDGVTTVFDDAGPARADAARARRLGMTGKLVIHPRQLDAVRQGFAPDPAEVAWARAVLSAVAGERGAVAVDGALVDAPVVARARWVLARTGG